MWCTHFLIAIVKKINNEQKSKFGNKNNFTICRKKLKKNRTHTQKTGPDSEKSNK